MANKKSKSQLMRQIDKLKLDKDTKESKAIYTLIDNIDDLEQKYMYLLYQYEEMLGLVSDILKNLCGDDFDDDDYDDEDDDFDDDDYDDFDNDDYDDEDDDFDDDDDEDDEDDENMVYMCPSCGCIMEGYTGEEYDDIECPNCFEILGWEDDEDDDDEDD